MGRLFGTDGVRGIANTELDSILAYELGRAGTYVLGKTSGHKPKIAVGMDTRISGDMLEAALVAGICSMGGEAILLGVATTPAVAYLIKNKKYDAGIVISASHNSYEFNGIKFFSGTGFKLSDDIENEIEAHILDKKTYGETLTGGDLGHKTIYTDALRDYVDFAKTTIEGDLTGLKISIDCANGASYQAASMIFTELGAEIITIHDNPNGININAKCGSTHTEDLQGVVKATGSDIGIAFDGDADRLMAIDENGEKVHGDFIMAICAKHLKSQGKLKNNTVVGTVMSNMGFDIAMKEQGINVVRSKVGDRYVLEEMRKNDFILGGEQSGHVIFLEHNTTGDGIISALQLLSVIKTSGKKLSELKSIMIELPQVLVNAKVSNEKKDLYLTDSNVQNRIREVEQKLGNTGRVLIRASGTEPLIRVMLEGADQEEIQKDAEIIADMIKAL